MPEASQELAKDGNTFTQESVCSGKVNGVRVHLCPNGPWVCLSIGSGVFSYRSVSVHSVLALFPELPGYILYIMHALWVVSRSELHKF